MSTATSIVIQRSTYWMRIAVSLQVCVKEALLNILHDPTFGGLPRNEQQLYAKLLQFKQSHGQRLCRIIKNHQWDKLCHICTPQSNCLQPCIRSIRTNSNDLDITAIVILIVNLVPNLPAPRGGWAQVLPQANDISKAAYVLRARDIRNTVNHCSTQDISTQPVFDDYWDDVEGILVGLGYKNMILFRNLKTAPLDPLIQKQIGAMIDKVNMINNKSNDKADKVHLQRVENELLLFNQDVLLLQQNVQKSVDRKELQFRLDSIHQKLDLATTNLNIMIVENKKAIGEAGSRIESNTTTISDNKKLICKATSENKEMFQQVDERLKEIESSRRVFGFKELSEKLKEQTKGKYQKVKIPFQPRQSSIRIPAEAIRDEIVVQLSLLENAEKFFALEETSTSASVNKQRVLQREISQSSIKYNEIITSPDDYVIVSGAPGYGKTTLIETLLYRWSCNELWSENRENGVPFQFVFVIYFRNLARFMHSTTITGVQLLQYFYASHSFNPEEMQQLRGNTLLILEGFDELVGKEKLSENNTDVTPFLRAVYDLLDPNNQQIPFTRLITSRPASCSHLFESVLSQLHDKDLTCFELTGFSENTVKLYISKHFKNTADATQMYNRFKREELFNSMMRIPFYCWGICYLFNNRITLENPTLTSTELFSNLLVLFIRNHGTVKNKGTKLVNVLKEEHVKTTLLVLAKMAFFLQRDGKITFTQKDVPENLDDLIEKSGLIIKIESEDPNLLPSYQFQHYSFHEFLVGIHLFVSESVGLTFNRYIWSFVSGLCGGSLENSESNYMVQAYAQLLGKSNVYFQDFLRTSFPYEAKIKVEFEYFLELLFEYQNKVDVIKRPMELWTRYYGLHFRRQQNRYISALERIQGERKITFKQVHLTVTFCTLGLCHSRFMKLCSNEVQELSLVPFSLTVRSLLHIAKYTRADLIQQNWNKINVDCATSNTFSANNNVNSVKSIVKHCTELEVVGKLNELSFVLDALSTHIQESTVKRLIFCINGFHTNQYLHTFVCEDAIETLASYIVQSIDVCGKIVILLPSYLYGMSYAKLFTKSLLSKVKKTKGHFTHLQTFEMRLNNGGDVEILDILFDLNL